MGALDKTENDVFLPYQSFPQILLTEESWGLCVSDGHADCVCKFAYS